MCLTVARYGTNLEKYYELWRASHSTQTFFHWLDEGDGRAVDLPEVPRSQLMSETVHYWNDGACPCICHIRETSTPAKHVHPQNKSIQYNHYILRFAAIPDCTSKHKFCNGCILERMDSANDRVLQRMAAHVPARGSLCGYTAVGSVRYPQGFAPSVGAPFGGQPRGMWSIGSRGPALLSQVLSSSRERWGQIRRSWSAAEGTQRWMGDFGRRGRRTGNSI